MTLEDLRYLQSKDAQKLLDTYKDTSISDLPRLTMKLKKKGYRNAHLITHQLELRNKAESKFTRAHEMLFSKEGLEQATSESIAHHIAHRIHTSTSYGPIMDATCGIGGNLIALAQYRTVLARDTDPVTLEIARHNAQIYNVDNHITFECISADSPVSQPVSSVFLDPARTQERITKTRSLTNTEPSITEIFPSVYSLSSHIAIKISPAFDYEELNLFSKQPEIEVIGHQKRNAVTMLWFGELAHTARRATIIHPSQKTYHISSQPKPPVPRIGDLQTYLYDPHPAVRKAHLIRELAHQYGLSQLDPHLSFLTSKSLIEESLLFRIFKVIQYRAFSLQNTLDLLREHHIKKGEIMTRAFHSSPDKLRTKLNLKEGGEDTLIFTTLHGKDVCLLTKRLNSFSD